MEQLRLELRLAFRKLVRQPGFSLAVIMLVGLGVGATTAVFTMVNDLLFSPPPGISAPEYIVRLNPRTSDDMGISTYADYEYFRDNARAFSSVFGYDGQTTTTQMRAGSVVADVDARFVTGNFFSGLGVTPAAGRLLQPADDAETAERVAVISPRIREQYFASEAAAVGAQIQVNGQSFTIVGVVEPEFLGAARDEARTDIYLPMWKRPLVTGRSRSDMVWTPGTIHSFMDTMARLKPGTTLAHAQANADALTAQLVQAHEVSAGAHVSLSPLFGMGPARRATVVMLSKLIGGLAVIVLLIVCANLANLMLARSVSRRFEMTIRLALGAGKVRLVQQLGVETLLLTGAGSLLGLFMAIWGARGLSYVLPFRLEAPPSPDARVFVFALGIALLTTLACALAPGLVAVRTNTINHSSTRTTGGSEVMRTTLVTLQIALCFVLLTGAALFVRTLTRVHQVDLGFRPQGLVSMSFDLRAHGYTEETAPAFYNALLERARALPGVRNAALGSIMPLAGGRRTSSLNIEGRPSDPENPLIVQNDVVSEGFYRTMGIPVKRGREFGDGDVKGAPDALIVNEAFATRYFAGQDPIGKRVTRGGQWAEIVGVVGDMRSNDVTEAPVPMFYRAAAQSYSPRMNIYLATSGNAANAVAPLRRLVSELDPRIVPRSVDLMEDVFNEEIRSFTANAKLVSVLGVVAAVLAAVGLYAVTAYLVAQRRREFGLRMAIGAQRGDVMRNVLGGALQRVGAGLAIGLLAALAFVPLVEGFLFELSPLDPLTFLLAAVLLTVATGIASYLPALRAARVDPMIALRGE